MTGVISFAQARMCVLDALDFRAEDSTVPFAWRIWGPLDISALRDALHTVIKRHVALRTRYTVTAGRPTAIVDHEPSVRLSIEHTTDPVDTEAFQEKLLSLAHLPFRLALDPVIRVFVIHAPGNETVLLIAIHHIAIDGVSIAILADELSELYSAAVSGRRPALPEVKVEYGDYAAWQQEWVRGQEAAGQLAYWRQALAGLDELQLPEDRPRRAPRSPDGKVVPFTLGHELSARISTASRDQRTSAFMFLLAAFNVVLSRYARQEDIPVGIPVEGRRPEFEEVVGLFVNTAVLRSHARHNLTFAEYLRDVRDAAFGALENQDVPFDLVVKELRPHRDLSRNPLFEVMFAFDSTGPAVLRLDGLEVEVLPVAARTMQFDLVVEIAVADDGVIGGRMVYAADLFERSTISGLSECYERVLGVVTERPDIRLGEIELMPPAEREKVISQAAGQAVARPDRLPHELFERHAAVAPARAAVVDGEDELSYERLNGDGNQLAHYLRDLGVTLDQPVGVCLPRGGPLPAALLAVLKAGGVYLPLDPALPDERIRRILAEAGAAAVVTDSTFAHRITAPGVPMVTIDADQPHIARQRRTNPGVRISPDNLAYILYTSGSTGGPEGAAIPHRALLNALMWSVQRHRIERADRIVLHSGISSDTSIWEMLAPLTAGASLVIPPEGMTGRERLMEYCRQSRATVLQVAPSHRPEALRSILRTRDAVIDCVYGPAECAIYATAGWCSTGDTGNNTIGTPIDNAVARVLDSGMRVVPPGLRGTLHIGGEGLGRGYLRNPRLTAERFVPDPYGTPGARLFETGDLVRNDDAGVLTFVSRSDRQVKLLGRTVRLDEIESAVTALPAVSHAAVVLDGPETARRLVCYFTPEGGADLSPNTLKQAMREILPGYMMPNVFVAVRETPSTNAVIGKG